MPQGKVTEAAYLLRPSRRGICVVRKLTQALSPGEGTSRAEQHTAPVSRRRLLAMIGTVGGSSAMYQAMTALGLAAESTYNGPIRLEGDPKGASVLILGAGVAGLVAALELHKIGY